VAADVGEVGVDADFRELEYSHQIVAMVCSTPFSARAVTGMTTAARCGAGSFLRSMRFGASGTRPG
jgi:hypothetical protein